VATSRGITDRSSQIPQERKPSGRPRLPLCGGPPLHAGRASLGSSSPFESSRASIDPSARRPPRDHEQKNPDADPARVAGRACVPELLISCLLLAKGDSTTSQARDPVLSDLSRAPAPRARRAAPRRSQVEPRRLVEDVPGDDVVRPRSGPRLSERSISPSRCAASTRRALPRGSCRRLSFRSRALAARTWPPRAGSSRVNACAGRPIFSGQTTRTRWERVDVELVFLRRPSALRRHEATPKGD
jgi:hypothetical protein